MGSAFREQVREAATAYVARLTQEATGARVVTFPPKGPVFYDVEIDGVSFRGSIYAGIFLSRYSSRQRGWSVGDVDLNRAVICNVPQGLRSLPRNQQTTPTGYRWAVCKYGPNEGRIDIEDLSPAARSALALQFGVMIQRDPRLPLSDNPEDLGAIVSGAIPFGSTPVFHALRAWAIAHPRMARDRGIDRYVERHQQMAAPPPTEGQETAPAQVRRPRPAR